MVRMIAFFVLFCFQAAAQVGIWGACPIWRQEVRVLSQVEAKSFFKQVWCLPLPIPFHYKVSFAEYQPLRAKKQLAQKQHIQQQKGK